MGKDKVFQADHVLIGNCGNPGCGNVHFQLCDASGTVRAQAVLPCESIDAITTDMLTTVSLVLAGSTASIRRH